MLLFVCNVFLLVCCWWCWCLCLGCLSKWMCLVCGGDWVFWLLLGSGFGFFGVMDWWLVCVGLLLLCCWWWLWVFMWLVWICLCRGGWDLFFLGSLVGRCFCLKRGARSGWTVFFLLCGFFWLWVCLFSCWKKEWFRYVCVCSLYWVVFCGVLFVLYVRVVSWCSYCGFCGCWFYCGFVVLFCRVVICGLKSFLWCFWCGWVLWVCSWLFMKGETFGLILFVRMCWLFGVVIMRLLVGWWFCCLCVFWFIWFILWWLIKSICWGRWLVFCCLIGWFYCLLFLVFLLWCCGILIVFIGWLRDTYSWTFLVCLLVWVVLLWFVVFWLGWWCCLWLVWSKLGFVWWCLFWGSCCWVFFCMWWLGWLFWCALLFGLKYLIIWVRLMCLWRTLILWIVWFNWVMKRC